MKIETGFPGEVFLSMEHRLFLSVFGQFLPYPITVNKGRKETSWISTLKLQIFANNELRNYETVARLRRHDNVTLISVCDWINRSFDGVLDSVKEEQDCLIFVIRIFSQRNFTQFRESWSCNRTQYELQRILLDKQTFLFREKYRIRFVECETIHKSAEEETEDGNESDDSAFSSLSARTDAKSAEAQDAVDSTVELLKDCQRRMEARIMTSMTEMREEIVKAIQRTLKIEIERLDAENKKIDENCHVQNQNLNQKFETLNENIMGMEARMDKMSSGRFQHVFQKVEMTKRLHEESYSKLVELENTATETNALVYELQQKFGSMKKYLQQSSRDQTKGIQNLMSSEYTKLENLIRIIQENLSTGRTTFNFQDNPKILREVTQSLDATAVTALSIADGGKQDTINPKLSNSASDSNTELMLENAEDVTKSKTINTNETTGTANSDRSEKQDPGQDVTDGDSSTQTGRPLSPTLAKALEDYEGDLLVSEDDGENDSEPVNFRETEELSIQTNPNHTEENEIIYSSDNTRTSGDEWMGDNVPSTKTESSQQPQIKTIEKLPTAKSYSSSEVTVFLKDPEGEEYKNDIRTLRKKSTNGSNDDKCFSDCDTDVEDALKASGLQKSEPVIQIVKKAMKEDTPVTRLHGLDTIICVDLSSSMSAKVLRQVQATLYSFLDIVEEVAIEDGLEENLGLVTFGRDTKICVRLTNDYGQLRSAIETMSPGGSSPLHTALSLCQLELRRNGHATCIHEHCIAPRIILFTDGRPTRDSHLDDSDLENAPKDPKKFDEISSFVQQLGNEGFQLFTVGVGRKTNTEFLRRLSHTAGGEHYPLDNTSLLAKYFKHQFITGKIKHEFRESGWSVHYQTLLQKTVHSQSCRLDRDDIERLLGLLQQSEEILEDLEYPGLPRLGSRVRTRTGQYGTVVKHRENNWVKVQFDSGEDVMFLHYTPNTKNSELEIVDLPRVEGYNVGAVIYKADLRNGDIGRGFIYDKTNSEYVKVKWENGPSEILKLSEVREKYKNVEFFNALNLNQEIQRQRQY